MKRIMIWAIAILSGLSLAIAGPMYFVSAGYAGADYEIMTRLEVSSDNATWVNYSAEENSGNQTLTVAPGGTVYWRIKSWNTGASTAGNTTFNGTFVNGRFIQDLSLFACDDQNLGNCNLDANDPFTYYTVSEAYNAGSFGFTLPNVNNSTTVDSGFESGSFSAKIAADTPDQSVITLTVTVASAGPFISWLDPIVPRAFADESATTTVRILAQAPAAAAAPAAATVITLPATGR